MNELVEKAKEITGNYYGRNKNDVGMEQLGLAIAFLRGEISARALVETIGKYGPNSVYPFITAQLRWAFKNDIIKVDNARKV